MDFFMLNGRRIKAVDVDFNLVAELSENGIDVSQIGKKMIPSLRVYVARCINLDVETAGQMIQQHVVSGGKMDEMISVFMKKVNESDFFQALSPETEENLIEEEKTIEVESKKVTPMKKKTTEA